MSASAPRSPHVLRALALAAGGVLLLLVLIAAVAPLLIPWDKFRPAAETKLTDLLHHRVTIGSLNFNLWRGLEVKRLRIENAPGFSREPLLSDEAVVVKYRLLPLLWGQVAIKAIVLQRPALRIERAVDGHFNFSDMLPAKAAPGAPPAAARPVTEQRSFSLPLAVLVNQVQVTNGSLVFRDWWAEQTYAVHDFDLDLENLTLSGLTPAKLTLSARLQARGQTLPVEATAVWRLQLAQQTFSLDRFQAGFPGLTLEVRGRVDHLFATQDLDFTGTLTAAAATLLATLRPFAPQLPAGLGLSGSGEVRFQIKGPAADLPNLQVSVQDRVRLQVAAAGLDVPVTADGRLTLARSTLDLSQKLAVPGGQTELTVAIGEVFTVRQVTAHLLGRVDLSEAMAKLLPPAEARQLAALKLAGRVETRATVLGPASAPKRMTVSGQIKADGVAVRYHDKPVLEKLNGTLTVLPDKVSLPDLRMRLGGQPFQAAFLAQGFDLREPATLKPDRLKAQVNWNVSSPLLDLDALLALVPSSPAPASATAASAAAAPATVSDLPEPDARTLLPAGLKMNGNAALGGLKFGTVRLGAISLHAAIAQRRVALTGGLQGYRGSMTMQSQLDFGQTLLGYALVAETKSVDLEPLLNDVMDTFVAAKLKKPEIIAELKGKLTGRLSGKLQLAGAGLRTVNAKPRLTGHGAFTLADGRLRQFSFQQDLAKYLGSEKFKQDIPFDHTVAEFNLANQEVNVTQFVAESGPKGESGDARLTAVGRLTFGAEFRDFHLRSFLNPRARGSLSPEFAQYAEVLKDDQGWTVFPVILNGPMQKPDTQPDWDWIKQQAGAYASKKAKAVADEAGKKVQNFFQGQQGKSAGEVKDNAAQELEKAKAKLKDFNLNNLFK